MFAAPSSRILLLAIAFVVLYIAVGANSKSHNKGSRFKLGGSSDYWFYAYAFSSANWPATAVSMKEWLETNTATFWKNRPQQATAVVCGQTPWGVKNYDLVSPPVSIAYFVKQGFLEDTFKVRQADCVYLWGDQQWYSYDDIKNDDRVAFQGDETKCSLDKATWDVTCKP